MDLRQVISFSLDLMLIAAAVASYLARPRIGGQLARGLRVLLIGVMVLGMAHLIETALFVVFKLELVVNEIVHRLLVVFGFGFVIQGFLVMRRAFEERAWTPPKIAPRKIVHRLRTYLTARF